MTLMTYAWKKPLTATTATTDTTVKNKNTLYYYSLKLPDFEIQKLVPIAPKQEKNLNLLQKRNGKNGRKARSKGCLIKTDNIQ